MAPYVGKLDQMVGPERVERSTSRLSGVRSNHLSYEPDEVAAMSARDRADLLRCARGSTRATTERKGNEGGGVSHLSSDDVWEIRESPEDIDP